jgi:hypothetical protein
MKDPFPMFIQSNKIELWVAADHYTIQYIKKDTNLSEPFPCELTDLNVRILCELLGIKFDPLWIHHNGMQINIRRWF